MRRRRYMTAVAAMTTAALAGCLFGNETLSTELGDGESELFEASDGEYEVTVDPATDDEVDVWIQFDMERTNAEASDHEESMTNLGAMMDGPVLDEHVTEARTFDVTIETEGYYQTTVEGGTADVTVSEQS